MPQRILQIGCGYLGQVLRDLLVEAGAEVHVITREQADVSDLEALRGVVPEHIDLVIHCASSSRGGPEAYRRVFVGGVSHLLSLFPAARLLFTSSTSVYGQTGGELVDESAPAEPSSETSRILREAEELVLAGGGMVARLAGIYGPGRWAQLRQLREGRATLEEGGSRWQNQIHRDDAAAALALLAEKGERGAIYNVADDLPLTQAQVYQALSVATGLPLPPIGPANPQRKRGLTSKRVSNQRLRDLGWAPRYPSMAEALRDPLTFDQPAGT